MEYMSVFDPQEISKELLKEINEGIKDGYCIDLFLYEINNLLNSKNWNDFLEILNQDNCLEVRFGTRLDVDINGKPLKVWNDLDFLNKLPKIKKLSIQGGVDNLEFLNNLNSLESFTIEQTGKKIDLNGLLKSKGNLKELTIRGNISGLEELSNFKVLNRLTLNKISREFDLIYLKSIPSLKYLELTKDSKFTNIDKINELGIKYLAINNSKLLKDIDFIDEMHFLEGLTLSSCKNLKMLPSFEKLKKLRYLYIENPGEIENWEVLRKLNIKVKLTINFPMCSPDHFYFLKDMKLEEIDVFYRTDGPQNKIDKILN